MKTKNSFIIAYTLIVTFLLPILVHAQPGFTDDVSDVPIDGGLSLLVVAAAGYGVKKLKSNKDKSCKN